MLTLLFSHCSLLHVSALKGPSSGSIDTFREQDHQNMCIVLPEGGPLRAETCSCVTVRIKGVNMY